MVTFFQTAGWPIIILFFLIHFTLLLMKKRQATLVTAALIAGCGALVMIVGLFSILIIGMYGAITMLLGLVLYVLAKDRLEGR
ncbi:hypothetical protein [Halobacillus sp. B23F22_1]|uniref:hypothetical protein n=1 Tax=Halobacillus sp. B23F22_1 TaxID=3459514 RepID=UPI00373F9604